jgi:hypothetical protein
MMHMLLKRATGVALAVVILSALLVASCSWPGVPTVPVAVQGKVTAALLIQFGFCWCVLLAC